MFFSHLFSVSGLLTKIASSSVTGDITRVIGVCNVVMFVLCPGAADVMLISL